MICPKCKAEYRDGFTECSDCGAGLVEKISIVKEKYIVSAEGIRLIKFGIILLFIAFAKMTIVILAYEFNFTYMRTHGFMLDVIFNSFIHPLIWWVFAIEIVVSLAIAAWGISLREKSIEIKKV